MPKAPVLLVTGTSKGIGLYLVKYFTDRGFLVAGCSRSDCSVDVPSYFHVTADVTDEQSVKGLVEAVRGKFGKIDALVNNAGIASMNHFVLTPVETVDRIMATNFRGTFLVSRECAKVMIRQRWGRIVTVSSVAVPMVLAGESIYAASKGAVVEFTRIMARELGRHGITCNAVGPAPIETDLIRGIPRRKIEEIIARLAIQRMCKYEDVANVVEFFLRSESDYVTGQVIYLGGP